MQIRVLYHDHCFDGAASAAFLSRFFLDSMYPRAEIGYTGLVHLPRTEWPDGLFTGRENAIVDFKYSPHPRLTWWFDHHESAFLSPADAEHFHADQSGRKFLDVHSKSCAKLIQTVARQRFGYAAPDLDELVSWANIVDGALYASAESAVCLDAPARRLALVIDNMSTSTVQEVIKLMQRHSLDEIAEQPHIAPICDRLQERHLETIDVIRRCARLMGEVVFFDLASANVETYNKFIPYYLFPSATYAVGITRSPTIVKVSVGSNPWSLRPLAHSLAAVCEPYGGGGHRVVAAISLDASQYATARDIAGRIVAQLNTRPETAALAKGSASNERQQTG
jgi:hypothetical protein